MMFPNKSIRPIVEHCRRLSTSPHVGFKFKLTEDLSKEFEEKRRALKKPEPEFAKTTLENDIIMGRVSSERYKKVIKVGVPKHRLNDLLKLYVRELDNVQAHDESDICKPGDWVLLRKEKDPIDKNVTHKVERIVYSYGKYIDPVTNRRSLGLFYDDDMIRLEKIKVEL